jgi:hypothetical protein
VSILAPMVRTPPSSGASKAALAQGEDSKKSYYLSKESLTFPGVAAAAGTILRVIDSTPGKTLALIIAVVLGGALVIIGYQQTPPAERQTPGFGVEAALMALLNIGLLWVAVLGVAVVTAGVGG